ncbi:MAG: YbaB/EbfC family nucleoid-associated protein [Lentisphaeria bacterium]|nr:YbaB/EbfC family nucleoid-associated protein [Lentisphaeria bacterium]
MFGNLGEMTKMLQKLGDIKKNMQQAREEMAAAEYTGMSADQQVAITLGGDFTARQVAIAPAAEADREKLQQQIFAALNDAMQQVRDAAKDRLKDVTGGINIPGM